jgi:tetratricopeptide (TPR) repeat protein
MLISISSFAQISYQNSYTEALKKAAASKKPVFVHAGISRRILDMKVRSFADDPKIATFFNKNFVNYMIPSDSPEFPDYLNRYTTSIYHALFFFSPKGELLFKAPHAARSTDEFLTYGQEALKVFKSGKSLAYYEQRDKAGMLSIPEFKEYVNMRIQSGIFDNADIAERYVTHLTVGQLDNYQEVLFILKAGPVAYGKAYKLAYTNQKLVDSIYKNEPEGDRIEINNRIISNTLNTAIATKNYSMLNNLSNFIQAIHGRNYRQASEQVTLKSLEFYKAVNDTSNYFSTASHHYDQTYMRQNVDSLKKLAVKNQEAKDEMNASMAKVKARAVSQPKPPVQPGKTVTSIVTRTFVVSETNSRTANALNSIAWDFYTMGTRNMSHLTKAMQWSMRSIEIDPDPAYYDTLAHIFYRMRLYDEAILNQNKAVELLKKSPDFKRRLDDAEAEILKMQNRTL